jgi:hypothetical protein
MHVGSWKRAGLADDRHAVLPDAHQLLRSIMGVEILTVTGKRTSCSP